MFLYTHGIISSSSEVVIPYSNTKSIELDGISDHIDCGNPSSLRITGTLSISAWFKTSSTSTQMIVGKDKITNSLGTSRNYMLFYSSSANSIRFTNFKNQGTNENVTATTDVSDGDWHHVLAVNDGSDMKIYIDGILEATNIGGGGSIQNTTSTTNFYIGQREGNTQNRGFWNGNLDEIAVWNNDQSGNLSSIYSSSGAVDLTSLNPVSYWRMGDGDSHPNIYDSVGSNDGEMKNMTSANIVSDTP